MDINYLSRAPKSSTFQMRINPEVKQELESLYSKHGLTFTDAVNALIFESFNAKGLPFLLSPENGEYLKTKAYRRLMAEVEKGWKSAEEQGWIDIDEAETLLGIDNE